MTLFWQHFRSQRSLAVVSAVAGWLAARAFARKQIHA